MSDGMRRFLRGALQIIAGGGLAGLFNQLVLDLPNQYDPYVVMLGSLIGVVAHLALESWLGHDVGVSRTPPNQ